MDSSTLEKQDTKNPKKNRMNPLDKTRTDILKALFDENGLKPNIDYISKKTGRTRRTIHQSLRYLKDEKVLYSYSPVLDVTRLGYSLICVCLLQIDMSKKEAFAGLKKKISKDPHLLLATPVSNLGVYNYLIQTVFKSLKDHTDYIEKHYCELFPEIAEVATKRKIIYLDITSFNEHKKTTISEKVIDLLDKE